MYSYLIGTVVEMNIDHIVVENSGIGYLIYVNNPYEYTRGKEIKIFLYQQVKEDALLLYGFKTTLINNNDLDEAAEVLIALGYKKSEVDKALAVLLNEKLDTNGYVKRALSLLVK